MENYGGHFTAAGSRGIGVYGWAENEGSENYGGYFVAEGSKGTGVYGRGSEGGFFTTTMAGRVDDEYQNLLAGVNVSTAYEYNPGIWIGTSGDESDGVNAVTGGDESDGFYARTFGDQSDGVDVWTYGYGSDGVYARTLGDESEGVNTWTFGDDGSRDVKRSRAWRELIHGPLGTKAMELRYIPVATTVMEFM
ncbi:MAG TPA: hypothetical protein EYP10_10350 [Armatimonadetes bacterium]|nr:hypothetical protein [Armatimonadota bacterium]